jgi:spore germination protein YaaH
LTVFIRRIVLGLAVLAMVLPTAPAVAVEPPPVRLASPEIFGWLPYWSLDANLDYGAITTIAYFGIGATADGHLLKYTANGSVQTEWSRWQGTKVRSIIDAAHAKGVKFVLTIERFAWDAAGTTATRTLLSNPDARASLVAEIVNEVVTRGIDGVNLDWEPVVTDQPGSSTFNNFAAFLHELRAGLDAANPAYQLTFATVGSQHPQMFADVTAAGDADAVVIMAYPLRDPGHNIAGGLAPFVASDSYDIKQIVSSYLNSNIAPDKIIVALPWYGRDWPTQSDAENARVQPDTSLYDRPRNIFYGAALNLAIANGRRYDSTEQSAWTAYRTRFCLDCPETWSEAYYEDVDSLGFKYDWIVNVKGLRGVGIFALGYDGGRPEFWKELRLKFRNFVDPNPPTGSFGLAANEDFCSAPKVRLSFNLNDGVDGSGPILMNVSNSAATNAGGLLSAARMFPAAPQIQWPLDDPTVGGSNATGQRTVYAQWRDVAGNWSPVSSTSFGVSSLAASASLTVNRGVDLTNTATIPVKVVRTGGGRTIATVRLSSSSAMTNGVLTYGVNGQPGSAISFSLVDPALGGTSADGRRSVFAQWRDSAGCWSAPVSSRITLDRVAPVGSLSLVDAPTMSLDGSVKVLAPATDAVSGVAELALSNDGKNWQSFAPSATPVAWSAGATPDGTWTISARWRDAAGNWSSITTTSLALDRTGPLGSLIIDGGAPATSASQVTLTAPASDISGVAEVLISNKPDAVGGVLSGATSFAPDAIIDWSLPGADTPQGAAEGAHTIYAQWRDGAGHWSNVAAATIVVDRTAPVVTAVQPGLARGGQLPTSGWVPILGSWLSSDLASGVASARVELVRQGDSWQPDGGVEGISPQSGQVDQASAWQLLVSATDDAGNASNPVASDPFKARVVQETDATIRYSGTWRTARPTGASGGATRFATARGATATLTFTGRAAAWVAPLGYRKGKAKVFIDGVLVATVDLRSAAKARILVFSRTWSTVGTHTLRIKVLGTANRPRIDVDAFAILT